jgi:hypothetical protein
MEVHTVETHTIRRVDIAVYSPDRKLQLVVEIKNKLGASAEWVTRMRHNLLTHSFIPHVPYFLLVLPDFFYLWTDTTPMNSLAKPDYKIEAAKMLAPYLKPTRSLNNLSGYGLELLTISWLEDMVRTDLQQDSVDPNLQWLLDSGLYEAIAHGSVAIEDTV